MSNTAGKVAYEAYYEYAQGTQGKSLVTQASWLSWEHLPAPIKEAWEVAAQAVRDAYAK